MLLPNFLRASGVVGRRAVTAGAALVLAVSAHSASATPLSLLQAGLTQSVTDGQPGAIGLVRQSGVSQYAAAGLSTTSPSVAADPSSRFRIGSNTKAFVSTVILQLEAQGLLSINDTVDHWLPGSVNANGNNGALITIKQLLNMTSGIPDYLANPSVSVPYALNITLRAYTPQDLVNIATSSAPTNAPGAAYSYSNTNYVLAGMIIEKITGHGLDQEIQQRIITPLGLANTFFPITDPNLYGNYLHGHNISLFNGDVSVSNVQVTWASGAIVSTLDDLATFHRALIQGNLLPPAQTAELKTTVPTGTAGVAFGLGVIWDTATGCAGAWAYNGEVLGYFSSIFTSADGTSQVVTVTNGTNMTLSLTTGMQDMLNGEVAAYCAMNP